MSVNKMRLFRQTPRYQIVDSAAAPLKEKSEHGERETISTTTVYSDRSQSGRQPPYNHRERGRERGRGDAIRFLIMNCIDYRKHYNLFVPDFQRCSNLKCAWIVKESQY